MSMFPQTRPYELEYGTDNRAVFNFFNVVYAWMAVGLAVTATVAWLVSHSMETMLRMQGKGFAVAFLLGAALLAFAINSAAHRIGPGVATALFLLFATIIGAAIAPIFIVYEMSTIGAAFLLTGGTFAVMSAYGFITKRDLSGMGSFLIMGVVGLFIASLVNIFLANNLMSWVITYGVLLVFTLLTAYHTQQLREIAIQHAHDPRMAARYAIVGSLSLYIAFINMFMAILRILGSRR